MNKEFDVIDLGLMNDTEVDKQEIGIFISQKTYTKKIIEKFKIKKSKLVSTHLNMVLILVMLEVIQNWYYLLQADSW